MPPNLAQYPSLGTGSSWECGIWPVVAVLHPGWGRGGHRGAGSPQGWLRRNYTGFVQKKSRALKDLEFIGQVSVLPGEPEGKGAVCFPPTTPSQHHHPPPAALSALGKALPSCGAEAGARVNAAPASGPRKLSFPLFMTKCKKCISAQFTVCC